MFQLKKNIGIYKIIIQIAAEYKKEIKKYVEKMCIFTQKGIFIIEKIAQKTHLIFKQSSLLYLFLFKNENVFYVFFNLFSRLF